MAEQIEYDDIFKAAKAFQRWIPALRDHTLRIKTFDDAYRIIYGAVNARGNIVSFEMRVSTSVVQVI